MLARHCSVLPGLAPRLAGRWHRVGLPEQATGIGVERVDMGACAPVSATSADDQLVADDKRSRG